MSDSNDQQFMRQMTVRSFWVSVASVVVPILIVALAGAVAIGNRMALAEARLSNVESRQASSEAERDRQAQSGNEVLIRLARLEEKFDALREALRQGEGRGR